MADITEALLSVLSESIQELSVLSESIQELALDWNPQWGSKARSSEKHLKEDGGGRNRGDVEDVVRR
jgi:hypothetical protein